MVNIHYTPGPKKTTHGSPALVPFLRELKQLDLPRDINNPIYFFNDNGLGADETKEVLRRFGGVYHTGAEARFNLAIAQLKRYPDFLSADSDDESHLWISTVFTDNALISYQSLFDLILQVSWIYYKVYTCYYMPDGQTKLELSTNNINYILLKCKLDKIIQHGHLLDQNYLQSLIDFSNSDIYIRINELANSSKHRQCINYQEVFTEDQLLVKNDQYCSADTLLSERLDDVIKSLKDYHNAIYDLIKLMAETHKLR